MSHMTLDDRVTIQEGLDNGLSIRVIAKQIGKQPSTVLREIDKRKVFKGLRYEGALAPCKRREGCQVRGLCKDKRCYGLCRNCSACKERCPDYFPDKCEKLSKSPYVCNGCEHFKSCNYESYYYYASHANNAYQDTLITAREGINQDPESLENLDKLISPLLQKGQSVSHVLSTHSDEIGCSRSTIYRYVNKCVLTARNTDLPRKVKLKKRAKSSAHKLTNEERMTILSRNYERFNKYLEQHPDTDVVETC